MSMEKACRKEMSKEREGMRREPDHPCPAPQGALLPRQAAQPQHYRDRTELRTSALWHTENLAEKADNHIAFSLLICLNPSLSTA